MPGGGAFPAPPQASALGCHRTGLRRLRAARVRSRPSPTPRPAEGRLPSALPHTTMPGTAASSGLAGPGAPAAAQCPRRGREEGREGVTPPRRAAPRSTLAPRSRRPALRAPRRTPPLPLGGRARRNPAPPPPSARSLTPPPPYPLRAVACSTRAAGGRLAPPHSRALPRGARAGSRRAWGDPERRDLRLGAPLGPPRPAHAPPPLTPRAAAARDRLTDGGGGSVARAILPLHAARRAPHDLRASGSGLRCGVGAALLQPVSAASARLSTLRFERTQVQGLTMLRTLALSVQT